jgi:glutathione synthase
MPSICFLTTRHDALHVPGPLVQRNDNPQRLPNAFAAAGWNVHLADHQELCLAGNQVALRTPHGFEVTPISSFDMVWVLGFGLRESFLDRVQLLQSVAAEKFVNSPAALLSLHAKYHLPLSTLSSHHPESYAGSDPEWLLNLIGTGGEWILKPPATSFGRSVFRVDRDDPNLQVIVEQLTGFDGSRYCLLQRYVPEIERGETRVLVANGQVIGAYLRRAGSDHRVNLAGDGNAHTTSLSQAERTLAQQAAAALATEGVRFAAIDMAWPWLIEFNLVNPGGLATIERLTGEDLSPRVVQALACLVRN